MTGVMCGSSFTKNEGKGAKKTAMFYRLETVEGTNRQ